MVANYFDGNSGQPCSLNSDGQVEDPYFSSSHDSEVVMAPIVEYFDFGAYLVVLQMYLEGTIFEVDLAVDVGNLIDSDDSCPEIAGTRRKVFVEMIELENVASK